jgi:hypothetical protein
MTTYHLSNTGGDAPVTVELAIPDSWKEDPALSAPDSPVFKLAGAKSLSLVAISPSASDDEARLAKITRRFDEESDAERANLPNGRVWMTRRDGNNVAARLFVPFPGGLVMAVAVVGADQAARLPEIRAVFESLTIISAPPP